jgi:hypothetical protein
MTEVPTTSYTVIDPQYILLDRPMDDSEGGQILKYIARLLTPAELDKIYMSETDLQKDGAERWKFMNYGSPVKHPEYHAARLCPDHVLECSVIVNESLVEDLRRALFPVPLQDPNTPGVNDVFIDWLAPHAKMQLFGLIYFSNGFRQYFKDFYYPQSYIIAEYIAFVRELRTPYKNEAENENWLTQFRDFQAARIEYWKTKLGMRFSIILM